MTQHRRGRPPTTTAEDWERAALDAIAVGGVAAVSVKALAVTLGTTKGSFYGYFANRDALVVAALTRWEHERTEILATALEDVPDPVDRLRMTIPGALADEYGSAVALTLLADAADPVVGELVHRITQRRLGMLQHAFAELGHPADEARRRAQIAYSLYLGAAALRRGAPDLAPDPSAEYAEAIIRMLTGQPDDAETT